MSKRFDITIYPQDDTTNLLFDGFIKVDTMYYSGASQEYSDVYSTITGVYENSAPTVNILLPGGEIPGDADNIFYGIFSYGGINIKSDKICNYYNLPSNKINLYSNFCFYQFDGIDKIVEFKLYGTITGGSSIDKSVSLTQKELQQLIRPVTVTGTKENPTVITLTEDCILNKCINFYVPDGQYVTFDGSNHYIQVSVTDVETAYNGLFISNSRDLIIKNLEIKNNTSYGTKTLEVGCGWFGNNFFSGTIENCFTHAAINTPSCGGIVGTYAGCGDVSGYCRIENCYTTSDLFNNKYDGFIEDAIEIGGICGSYAGANGECIINNCYSTGEINSVWGGGIVGYSFCNPDYYFKTKNHASKSVISNCYSTGTISGLGSGGIIGDGAGSGYVIGIPEIKGCYSVGEISGEGSGGIAGANLCRSFTGKMNISNCYSTGNITGSLSGGIVGYLCCNSSGLFDPSTDTYEYYNSIVNITNCYSTGFISSGCGGIAGSFSSSGGANPGYGTCNIINCYTTGITETGGFNIADTQYGTIIKNSNHTLGWNDNDAEKYLIPVADWKKVTPNSITNQPWKITGVLKEAVFEPAENTLRYTNTLPINIFGSSEPITLQLENEMGNVISDKIVLKSRTTDVLFTNVKFGTNDMNIYIVIDSVGVSLKAVTTGYYNAGDYLDYYLYVHTTTTTTNTTTYPICYNKGTKILCLTNDLQEDYIPIENIKKGMLVKTYKHGYRRVELIGSGNIINNTNNPECCMYILPKNGSMIDNLIVTGGHSLLVDKYPNSFIKDSHSRVLSGNTKIDDKYLLMASLSGGILKPINSNERFTYYHLVLDSDGDDETRYGIWANGILSESVSKKEFLKRNMKCQN